jgi:vanillate O-demethylase ferredoxin subunit
MTARMIMKLRVEQARLTSPDVLHLDLVHPLRPELPEWTAGAHVDVRMSDDNIRFAEIQRTGRDIGSR